MNDPFEPILRTEPRYCPQCNREADPGASLCRHCGDQLLEQGYCPICEQFWLREVGTSCPKHDVALGGEPFDADFPGKREPGSHWVTVKTFGDAPEAEAVRIRLEAEGIPTFLEGARMGSRSMYLVATGGVKLQVPQALVAEARVLLSQSWAPVVNDDDLDDAWDELAPEPGAGRRRIMKAAILLMLFGPALLTLIASLLRL